MQQILIWSLVSGFVELVVVVGGVGANSRVMFGTDRNRTVMCCKGEIHLMVQRSRKLTFPRGGDEDAQRYQGGGGFHLRISCFHL